MYLRVRRAMMVDLTWKREDLETRVPTDHPLRVIKMLADQALKALSPDLDRMYANVGRPSIPPERLLKSSLLIALYSVRSERAFCEQLDYNLLFRWFLEWFLDMNLIEPSFDATTFTKNRERLLRHGVGQALFGEVVLEAERQGLLSDEHFTVDGTLIEAAASLKSFKPKDGDPPRATDANPGNPSVDFHGERRSNATHQSTTDPEARLLRKGKGKEARLVFMAHALMQNRHGMLVDFQTRPCWSGSTAQALGPDQPTMRALGPSRGVCRRCGACWSPCMGRRASREFVQVLRLLENFSLEVGAIGGKRCHASGSYRLRCGEAPGALPAGGTAAPPRKPGARIPTCPG